MILSFSFGFCENMLNISEYFFLYFFHSRNTGNNNRISTMTHLEFKSYFSKRFSSQETTF